MYSVYAIYNPERDKVYIGHTADLQKRLARHNGNLSSKKTAYTSKNDGSWELVYSEECATRKEARQKERVLKNGNGRAFVWGIIKNQHH